MLDDFLNALQLGEENLVAVDTDDEGIMDVFSVEYGIDTDWDGLTDMVVTETFEDLGYDSQPDYYSITEKTAADGDELIDHTVFLEDTTGGSFLDTVVELDAGEDGMPDMEALGQLETSDAEAYCEFDHFAPTDVDMDGIIGNPSESLDSWHVQSDNTCAVVSQEFILENLLDREFDEG